MKRRLLCTDLDGTLIPNGAAVESPLARELFQIVAERSEVTLVYVTGRHLELIKSAIREHNLLGRFRHWRCGYNDIRSNQRENWILIKKWQKQLALAWPAKSVKLLRNQLANIEEIDLTRAL